MGFTRNVFIYDGRTKKELAGFWQYGHISISNFYKWLSIAFIVSGVQEYSLFPCAGKGDLKSTGKPLERDSKGRIEIGCYVILDPEGEPINIGYVLDHPLRREFSYNFTETTTFCARIRKRDKFCCLTRRPVVGDNYAGFEAIHIFPLGQPDEWNRRNLQKYITDPYSRGDKMNSVQQGFLCCATEHRLFVDYQIGVDVDDNYRITDFGGAHPDYTLDGKTFHINRDVPKYFQPSDALLRDHYTQCVLACMKGGGPPRCKSTRPFEPELDLAPGGFDLSPGNWWASDEGKEQFEVEMAARLSNLG